MSCVTCHVSHVTCHLSPVTCQKKFFFDILIHIFFLRKKNWTKWWSQSVQGLLSTGPTPSSLTNKQTFRSKESKGHACPASILSFEQTSLRTKGSGFRYGPLKKCLCIRNSPERLHLNCSLESCTWSRDFILYTIVLLVTTPPYGNSHPCVTEGSPSCF